MENETKEKKNSKWIIVLIILILLFLISAVVFLMKILPQKNEYKEKYTKSSSVASEVLPDNPIDFKSLQKDNPDVIAWIKIDDTVIDYPILMSGVDKEEDYYINHDMSLAKKSAGSIYVQRENSYDFSDYNTVIYGHNMMNGSMFGTLKKFRNKTYFDEHRTIYIYIPKHILKYEISSAFLHDDRHLLSSYSFFTAEGRKAFADVCINPNTLVKNIVENLNITDDDRLITLSTCTSVDSERYLVVGRLIEDTKTN